MTTTQQVLLAAANVRNRVVRGTNAPQQLTSKVTSSPAKFGQVMSIQGIRDLVEEYLGEHRDIFRKNLVHSKAIFEGAMMIWEKKQHSKCAIYMANISMDNFDAMVEVDMHFIDLYEVRCGDNFYNKYTYNQHVKNLHFVFDDE